MKLPTSRAPTSPGELLLEEWLKPMKLTQLAIAKRMGVDIRLVNGIVNGRQSVTAKTALLLAKVLETTPEFWLDAQRAVDLWRAQKELMDERHPLARSVIATARKNARKAPVDRDAAARRRVLNELATMSQPELFALAVRAGIYTKSGKLTKHYRDDAAPSACRPTD